MIQLPNRLSRISASLGLATALALGIAIPAFAAGETGVTVTGAGLSGGGMGFNGFSAITLDGTQRTATATFSIANLVDPRGTGAGWNHSLTLTTLKEYDTVGSAYVVSGKELAASSMRVTTASIITLADATSSAANTVTPIPTTTALDTVSPVKLVSAAVAGGMGSYAVSDLTATLTVPASAYAKTYKTDATVSLNTAP